MSKLPFKDIVCFFMKAKEFIKRDFFTLSSYRTAFVFNMLSIFISVASFYFISETFGRNTVRLKLYGGEYFPFIIIGIAFFNYIFTAIGSFSEAVRREQMLGTLEMMLMSPTKLSTIIILTSVWSFIYSSFIVLVYLGIGFIFFNLTINLASLPVCFVILIIGIITFSSLGIISASFVMIFKKGDPIKWFLSMGSSFLSGAFFPIGVLPESLQAVSKLIPTTYFLEALRLAMLKGYSFSQLSSNIIVLLVFCVLFMPFSIYVFKFAVEKVKKDGSLSHY